MATILVLEDDSDISSLISTHLTGMQYRVDVCHNGVQGLQQAIENPYDLIILDLGLPEMDGLDVCKRYRASNELTPILMLTARNTELDKVIGLEMGADDYLGKPFSIRELQARVKAMLRRYSLLSKKVEPESNGEIVVNQDLRLDPAKRQVRCRNNLIDLTAREFDLLFFLASNPGRVYNREQLLDKIWGYSNSYFEHTINSNINRLRSKIELDPARPEFILTVRGVGYKFFDGL